MGKSLKVEQNKLPGVKPDKPVKARVSAKARKLATPAIDEEAAQSDERIQEVGRNIQEKAALVWNVANSLFGAYKPHEYGLVILPLAIVKRFHDCLLPVHQAVLDKYKELQDKNIAVRDGMLREASGWQFYNTSRYTFEMLKADPQNIETNFRDFINGFSDNIQNILERMNFSAQIDRMVDSGLLYQVICDFCSPKADMSPETISAVDMGYIFENLVQRFSESYNEEAGAHFTSRDIIYLMCDLLVTGENDFQNKTIYDMAMGTSQMLTCMEERLKQLDAEAETLCFGQELNPFTYGIAMADMLIRGGDPENMRFGNTLDNDQFDGYDFDYCISNPPFGIDWKREADKVEAEHKKGFSGRFAPGLPGKSDGQMLFLLNGIAKLRDDGRMAIIQNGSSLFTGDAGSGPSQIRKYIIENDWLEAIVQLPGNSFYNTGITTYIWIINKNKAQGRKGKVILIDASKCYETRRKSIGKKRVDITGTARDLIVKAFGDFNDGPLEAETQGGKKIACKAKVLDNDSFGYTKITVESPKLDKNGKPVKKNDKIVADSSKRDTENVPLGEDISAYFEREVKPYNPDGWIDESRTKVGYEIQFNRVFYEYKPLQPAEEIIREIKEHEKALRDKLQLLFGDEGI